MCESVCIYTWFCGCRRWMWSQKESHANDFLSIKKSHMSVRLAQNKSHFIKWTRQKINTIQNRFNDEYRKIAKFWNSDITENFIPGKIVLKFTLLDKISADKSAENQTCCRKFCPPKILSAEKFCPPKYFACWNLKHVKLIQFSG